MRMEAVVDGVNVHTKIDKRVRKAVVKIATETAVDQTVVYNTLLKRGLATVGEHAQTTRKKAR